MSIYSPAYYAFGTLLRSYRCRMSGERNRQEWLGRRLGHGKTVISKWETGDLSAPLPDRDTIKHLGRLYSLSCEEVNHLLEAAATTARARRNRKAETYTQLTPEEAATWRVVLGPSRSSMATWQETLALAKKARRAGELHTARTASALLLEQVELSSEDPKIGVLWSAAERWELDRLWMESWYEFYQAASHLETSQSLVEITVHYFVRTRGLIRQHRIRPQELLLGLYNEADIHHILKLYREANTRQAILRIGLTCVPDPNYYDYALEAQTCRLIILDVPYTTSWQDEVMKEIRKGRCLADEATSEHLRERIMLLEAIGRTLAIVQNAQCWTILDTAISEARGHDPVAYVSCLYSYLIAEQAHPRSGKVDQDAVLALGREALVIADTFGWQRRSWQIKRAARRCGVSLE